MQWALFWSGYVRASWLCSGPSRLNLAQLAGLVDGRHRLFLRLALGHQPAEAVPQVGGVGHRALLGDARIRGLLIRRRPQTTAITLTLLFRSVGAVSPSPSDRFKCGQKGRAPAPQSAVTPRSPQVRGKSDEHLICAGQGLGQALLGGGDRLLLFLTIVSVLQVIFGLVSDRFGRKWPLVVNLVLIAVLSLGTGFVNTFKEFLALRSLFGIAMGGIWGLAASVRLSITLSTTIAHVLATRLLWRTCLLRFAVSLPVSFSRSTLR